MSRERANKYHPALVLLHWLLAWFIIASLLFGFFVLRTLPNTDARKIDMLEWHMGLGNYIQHSACLLERQCQGFFTKDRFT